MLIFRIKECFKIYCSSNSYTFKPTRITMHDSSEKAINNGNKHIINIYWMAKKNIPIYILKLIEIVHSIRFSSVDCEKSFSKQNIIKCNVMKNDTLHILILIGLEGTD